MLVRRKPLLMDASFQYRKRNSNALSLSLSFSHRADMIDITLKMT